MIKKKNFDCCWFMLNCWRYSRNFFSTKNKNESFKMSAPPKFTILLPVRAFSIQTVSSFWRLRCTESGRTVEGDQEVLRALAHFLSGWLCLLHLKGISVENNFCAKQRYQTEVSLNCEFTIILLWWWIKFRDLNAFSFHSDFSCHKTCWVSKTIIKHFY